MEFRKAYIEEAELICNVVQTTKKVIYPLYYTKEVVDFFGKLHCIDNIKVDIEAGRIYEIMEKQMPDRNMRRKL